MAPGGPGTILVTAHCLEEEPQKTSVYADFDVRDISLENRKFRQSIREHGYIIGTSVPLKRKIPENGYFAFTNGDAAKSLLTEIIDHSRETRKDIEGNSRSAVYYAYTDIIMGDRQRMARLPDVMIQTLKPCFYKIVGAKDYLGISIG